MYSEKSAKVLEEKRIVTAPVPKENSNEEIAQFYKNQILEEQNELEQIEQTIKLFEENIMNQKRQVGGVHAVHENQKQMQSQIHILETRLNRTVQKFNSITTQNVALRSEIESLKQERQEFERFLKKCPKKK